MTSKEALEQIMEKYIFYVPARSEGKEHLLNCLNIVAKDLERLEKVEKDIITTYEFNKKLRKENAKLKQAIDILKDKIQFEDLGEMQSGNIYRGYFNDCFNEEEFELLEEVFGNG